MVFSILLCIYYSLQKFPENLIAVIICLRTYYIIINYYYLLLMNTYMTGS